MEPWPLFFQKRTGIKDSDIDGFVKRAEEVEKALKGLLDGSVNPDEIQIEGLETEEQKKKKEVNRLYFGMYVDA